MTYYNYDHLFRQRGDQQLQGDMKKSPSTPNLNWRYAVAEDAPIPNAVVRAQDQVVVRRRQRKVQRPRPRSEIKEKTFEETWIDGER